jgi:hypothetical protein
MGKVNKNDVKNCSPALFVGSIKFGSPLVKDVGGGGDGSGE